MFKTLVDAFKNKDIRKKIFITLGLLLLFRLGCWIPVPGINLTVFKSSVESQDFLNLLSGISGGALSQGAILALGVSPYISASIIVQLLTLAIPPLERLSKQGEEGRKKIASITKWVTLFLGLAQAIGIVVAFGGDNLLDLFMGAPKWITGACVVIILTAGSLFTYWLGEKITEVGISNGVSMLIFVGILSTAATSMYNSLISAFTGNIDELWNIIIFLAVLIIIFALIVMMDGAERKVKVQYAKQIRGRQMVGGQSTYYPIRLMGTGVMPIIFAMSFLSFPQIIMSIFCPTSSAAEWYSTYLGAGSWAYSVILGLLILGFAYFYAQMSFNPEDVSKQIQSNGGFVPGIRPGKPTSDYLKKISNRITLFGAIFLAFIAIVPTLVFKAIGSGGLINAFSATGMIIVVGVALEVHKALEQQLMLKNYRGFLK